MFSKYLSVGKLTAPKTAKHAVRKGDKEGGREVVWREGAGEVWFLVPGLGSVICLSKTCLDSRELLCTLLILT